MGPPVRPRDRPANREAAERPELVLAGRAWYRGRLQAIELGIDEAGRICTIGRDRRGARRHDVGDRVLLPSASDLHVHLREPGPPDAGETIATGTVAAAVGGVGLVGEMPNTDPPVTSVDRLEAKAARVQGRAAVDVLLYAAAQENGPLAPLARGAGGFKLYMSPTPGIAAGPEGPALARLLEELARFDLPLAVHAEDPGRFVGARPPVDPVGWDRARPAAAESAAIDHLLGAPDLLRLHVAHVTSAAAAARLRARGVSCEVTPHHLLLAARRGADARFKVNPPLRSESERAALWARFASGDIACVASDHAPHSVASKSEPFARAPSGVPGVETMLPLLLARVGSGALALPVLLRAACDRPARILGQPVGRLAVGHRANLLVVDFRARTPVRADRLRSGCGWSPFEGMAATFPTEHWRDGRRIVQDGEYVGVPDGAVVRPEYAPGETGPRPRDDGRR